MVPMGVTDQKMNPVRSGPGPQNIQTQLANTGTAVEDDCRTIRRTNLDAGCISAISRGPMSWSGNRTACSPKTNAHFSPPWRCLLNPVLIEGYSKRVGFS